MQYIKLLSSVLALCLMLTSNAYAATVDGDSPTANLPEDIPDWALRPALEPDEDPADEPAAGTVEDPTSERGYTTIYNADGTLRYTDDPALLAGERPAALPAEADSSLFFEKPFAEYTVTEGCLLLFLVLGFCWVVWKIIKGVF